MKKAVIMLLVLVVPTSLWAMDINQGKYELSGTTAFNFSDTSTEVTGAPDIDTTSFSFELDGNYYFRNNLGLGLLFLYENDEVDSGGDQRRFIHVHHRPSGDLPLPPQRKSFPLRKSRGRLCNLGGRQ